ncbi:glycosyltransferase family 4 protein [Eubacterium oxidoreducens]|uniref:Galacturonosyltransferase n=1 Tax=Eubacterium oxidoreducens TaxID=1732 RepID=A0A1G6BKZ7_EUBOX|nr:glycosyltransferase family 4 protein [Eubacterium oxidoreducens]SDB21299.1 galacturonosyltransferase [Eubacterium oxidoreducens]
MSKVLILANFDVGLYKFRKELIAKLLHKGHEVFISLPFGDMVTPLIQMGCKFIETDVDRRGVNPKTDRALMKKYETIIREVMPDLVVTYTIKPNIYGAMACEKANIPCAINITGLGSAFQKSGPIRTLVIWMYKKACKKVRIVFFENEGNRQTLLDYHIVRETQTHLLHGAGVNLKEYPFCEYPDENESIHFLFIGRIMKEKGMDELFAAMERICEKREDVVLDLVGFYEENYEQRIRQLEEQGIVKYHGYQEDVRPFIERCSGFVLPSYHEGMANTLLECASMGRPLLTSDIPGCKEAVEDGQSGLLFKVQDEEALYEKMMLFLDMPYEQRKKMGMASRKHMELYFDKNQVVNDTYEQLEKILTEK